ncbi:MAG: glutaredoxin family protein [Burkholderiales bacterium]|nr:glutaredoxin family protein [Burkholderiales bacterium]
MQRFIIALFVLAAPFAMAAKVYQWKDANGNVVFSDQPPAGQQAQQKDMQANVVQTSGGTYTTREAVRKSPVTLWANNCGADCDSARALLGKRGVPYSLRNPQASQADYEALNKLAGAAVVPVLQVGSGVLKGFNEENWQAAIDQAGYPKSADPTLKGQQPAAGDKGKTAGKN